MTKRPDNILFWFSPTVEMPRPERIVKLKVLRCLRDMFKLAVPVVVSRLGSVMLTLTGTVMVGHYSTDALAFQSIACAIDILLVGIVQGLLQGTIVMTANAFGQGRYHECGAILRRSIPYAAWISFFCLAICLPSRFIMSLLGQPPEIAEGAANVLTVNALGLPFYIMFFVMASFMEGTKRPLPGMIIVILANVVNVLACYAFIYGHFGFPAMGAVGFAASITVIRVMLAIGMFICVFCIDEQDVFGVWIKPEKNREENSKLRGIGYGAAVTAGVEEGAYSIINIMVGWLGALALGAYSIMLNVINNIFMAAVGIGTSAAVLMGIAKGKKSVLEMRIVGFTALFINFVLMTVVAVVLLTFPRFICSIYSSDGVLIEQGVPLLMLCSVMCFFDSGQQVLVSVLRGAVDIFVPTVCQALSFCAVMLPATWLLAFRMDYGILGIAYAMTVACACSFVMLFVRFEFLCRKYRRDGFDYAKPRR